MLLCKLPKTSRLFIPDQILRRGLCVFSHETECRHIPAAFGDASAATGSLCQLIFLNSCYTFCSQQKCNHGSVRKNSDQSLTFIQYLKNYFHLHTCIQTFLEYSKHELCHVVSFIVIFHIVTMLGNIDELVQLLYLNTNLMTTWMIIHDQSIDSNTVSYHLITKVHWFSFSLCAQLHLQQPRGNRSEV